MENNQQLIEHFYTCFKNKDFKGMQECYADNAAFSDAVFVNLNAKEVKAMWEMLLKGGKDLQIAFKDIAADKHTGKAHWDAYYTFSATGNKVVNKIDASFEFENGKIVKHIDSFNFYAWAKQSLGLKGLLLGWTSLFKQKVRKNAREKLNQFIAQNH